MVSKSGSGVTQSIGVGLRYISPDTQSGATGTYIKTLKSSIPSGEGTVVSGIHEARKSTNDYNMQEMSM